MLTVTETSSSNFSTFNFTSVDNYANANVRESTTLYTKGLNILLENNQSIHHALPDFIFEFKDFKCDFKFELIDIIWENSSEEIGFIIKIDDLTSIRLDMNGSWEGDINPGFYPKKIKISLNKKAPTPSSAFYISTLWAVIGLSKQIVIKMPEINFELSGNFDLPVKELQLLLQDRQLAQRLLIIETALGISLPMPDGYINGFDVENIAFCYHAIFDREFDWYSPPQIIPWKANKESLSHLPKTKEPSIFEFAPEIIKKPIFGKTVFLGSLTAIVRDAVIDNFDEVVTKLSKLNNKTIGVKFRAISGKVRIISVSVPKFNLELVQKDLQSIFNLDQILDKKLMQRYFNLASSTLDFLTSEQKKAVTERPKIKVKPSTF